MIENLQVHPKDGAFRITIGEDYLISSRIDFENTIEYATEIFKKI